MPNFIYNKDRKIYYFHKGEIYESRFKYILLAFCNTQDCKDTWIDGTERNKGFWIESIYVEVADLGVLYWNKGRYNSTLDPSNLFLTYSDLTKDNPLFECNNKENCYFNYEIVFTPTPPKGCFWCCLPFNEHIFNLHTWEWGGKQPLCNHVKNASKTLVTDQPCFDIINDRWLIDKNKKYYGSYDECLINNRPKIHRFNNNQEEATITQLKFLFE